MAAESFAPHPVHWAEDAAGGDTHAPPMALAGQPTTSVRTSSTVGTRQPVLPLIVPGRNSIEARAPFLDPDLVAYGLSLPQAMKISGAPNVVGKRVLKKALEGILPDSVLYRKKQGFRVPLPEWLRGPLAGWARRQVLDSALMRRGIFNRDYVEAMWQRHQTGTVDHSFDLWCLINLGAWYERWIEPRGAA